MRKINQISVLLFTAVLIITGASAQLPKLPKILAFGNITYGSSSSTDFFYTKQAQGSNLTFLKLAQDIQGINLQAHPYRQIHGCCKGGGP